MGVFFGGGVSYGPMIGEGDIGEVVVVDAVVENELVVSLPPVVADSFILVNYQCWNTKHFESCADGEPSLSHSCRMLALPWCGVGIVHTHY